MLSAPQVISLSSHRQTVQRYFQTFNQGDFATTASLFAVDGCLLPPFEEPVVGPAAITAYLQQEADGMHITLRDISSETLAEGRDRICITAKGSVKAMVFTVNVAWEFELTPQGQIAQVEIQLLASLQELLSLRS